MKAILSRIADGDASAVADCLDEYGGLVWRLAHRYLDRSTADVEDAVQEIFVELWLNAKRFDPARGSEPAFVATVAHRRLIDWQRRTDSRLTLHRAARATPLSPTPDALASSVRSTKLARIAEEFDRLPPDERQALWLSIHNGMSHSQIADATGSPIGTIKTRLRRALMRLHDALGRSAALCESERGA